MLVIFKEDFGARKKGEKVDTNPHFLSRLLERGIVEPVVSTAKEVEEKPKAPRKPRAPKKDK